MPRPVFLPNQGREHNEPILKRPTSSPQAVETNWKCGGLVEFEDARTGDYQNIAFT
jgi:hypothetical protein